LRQHVNTDPGFSKYLEWLSSHYNLTIQADQAFQDETFDSQTFSPKQSSLFDTIGEIKSPLNNTKSIWDDHTTLFTCRVLEKDQSFIANKSFWEVGCGQGAIATLAARAGASQSYATDIDPTLIQDTEKTASRNKATLETSIGSLLDGTRFKQPVDIISANLPQKPTPDSLVLSKSNDGGADGTSLLLPFLEQAKKRLTPNGRLYFFLHSLPHPSILHNFFSNFQPTLRAYKTRLFHKEEHPELLDYLVQRFSDQSSYIVPHNDQQTTYSFYCMLFSAEVRN